MIDDIVFLPNKLNQFRGDAEISSEQVCVAPISNIPRSVGYETPDDTRILSFGSKASIPTGKDAWFRFKIIENTINGIVEYFCLSESPIDILNVQKSAKTLIYCVWVTVTDVRTLEQRKFVLWDHIRLLMWFKPNPPLKDIPIEAVIADELRLFAKTYGSYELLQGLTEYPATDEDIAISEVGRKHGTDTYLTVYANMNALNEIYALDRSIHAPDPIQAVDGADLPVSWTDTTPLQRSTVIRYFLLGPVEIGQLMFLFSSRFGLHCYQRGFDMSPLPGDTEIDVAEDDELGIFSIIEYIETIPYGEFELTIGRGKQYDFVRFNPFDMNVLNRELGADHSVAKTSKEVADAVNNICTVVPIQVTEVKIARSWAEEVYITFKYANGKFRRFFVDLVTYAICSRSLIRDYKGPGW